MTEEELNEKCQSCNVNKSYAYHACPLKEDIHDDKEYQCNCCAECTQNCVYEI